YTGPGWEVTGAPEVTRLSEGIVGIGARLTWRGAEGFTSAAVCRATLVDDAGKEVWAGTGRAQPLGRVEELGDYPYRTTVVVTTGGEPVEAEGIGEFTCRSL
ncbi:MAG TPA: hypothetical protein VFS18_01860, partial [Actinomycetota bacterium]|nr:hypothetical protein [Actinomycetota bacterium]